MAFQKLSEVTVGHNIHLNDLQSLLTPVMFIWEVQFRAFSRIVYYNIKSTDNFDISTRMRTKPAHAQIHTQNEHYITLYHDTSTLTKTYHSKQ